MGDLGERVNVMGPQPISERAKLPAAMLEAAHRVIARLTESDAAGLAALAAPAGAGELAALGATIAPGNYDRTELIATARVNDHHYVKARMHGPRVQAVTVQFRLGEYAGEWRVWEATNLTGKRGAWTR